MCGGRGGVRSTGSSAVAEPGGHNGDLAVCRGPLPGSPGKYCAPARSEALGVDGAVEQLAGGVLHQSGGQLRDYCGRRRYCGLLSLRTSCLDRLERRDWARREGCTGCTDSAGPLGLPVGLVEVVGLVVAGVVAARQLDIVGIGGYHSSDRILRFVRACHIGRQRAENGKSI